MPLTILFLSANPVDRAPLRSDQEQRDIAQALRGSRHRSRFELRPHAAVRPDDLQELLRQTSPTIVHLSAHGNKAGELLLEDENGHASSLDAEALAGIFAAWKGRVRCVVLNACYSQRLAEALALHVDCVVGMASDVADRQAIRFAVEFYAGVGSGESIEQAVASGRSRMHLAGGDHQMPQLLAQQEGGAARWVAEPAGAGGEGACGAHADESV